MNRNAIIGLALVAWMIWQMRRAAKHGPRVSIRTTLALVMRWPLLATWALGTAGWLCLFVPSAIAKGEDLAPQLLLAGGLSLFLGFGLAVFVSAIGLMVVRSFKPAPQLALEPGEVVIQERIGNHVLRGEGRGGKLLLTNRRLGFRPHRFNLQSETWSIRLDDVRAVQVDGGRYMKVERAAPGEPEWLVTADAQGMAEQVNRLRQLSEAERR